MADMTFFLQNHLRVAGNAPRQRIIGCAGRRAWGNRQHIDTGNACAHSGRGGAQNIDPRVNIGKGAQTCFGVNLRRCIGRADRFSDIGEQHPRGSYLGQCGEEVDIGGDGHGNFGQGLGGIHACGFQSAQAFGQFGQHPAKLLRHTGTLRVKRSAIGGHQTG
ncbi:MAG: Uncharacterised protein [Alphaproteobacteria bacterium]|nr:MAG: Uncharacterised protein [Alphaproteobacteria bacterium]